MNIDKFSAIYWQRRFGSTVRFHGQEWAGTRETILHHSANVALLLLNILGLQCTSTLLAAAMTHDLAEGVTGDIPAPTKRLLGNERIADLEKQIEAHYAIPRFTLTEDERRYLKAADFIDACFTCLMQRLMGNTNVDWCFDSYVQHELKTDLLAFDPEFKKLFTDICVAYRCEVTGTRHTSPVRDAYAFRWQNNL